MEFKLEQLEYQQQAIQLVISVFKGQGENTLGGFQFKNTKKLDKNADLQEVTGNIIYKDYILEQIAKSIRGKGFGKFKNDAVIYEGEQLYWLIDSQFRKKEKLKQNG